MDATVWAPVIAALGASLLTGLSGFGLIQWQRWRDDRASTNASKQVAYNELHARAYSFVRRVGTLGLAKQFRSGIAEGVGQAVGQRKPLDVFQLHEWLEADFRPLTDAYSKVCLIGSQEAVDVANRVLAASSDLIGAAVATGPQQGPVARLIKGEAPTPKQVQAFEAAQTRLYKELEALVTLARREVGSTSVLLPLARAELEASKGVSEEGGTA